MREYLFRAKGQTDNRWHYGRVNIISDDVAYIYTKDHRTMICNAKTVERYENLIDKVKRLFSEG